MVRTKLIVNVDTGLVETTIYCNIGDRFTVKCSLQKEDNNMEEPSPVQWQMRNVGSKCLKNVGENGFEGTMDFECQGAGTSVITYTITGDAYINISKDTYIICEK